MVEVLDWDSEFFGYKVGQIVLTENKKVDEAAILRWSENFKLVYVISDSEEKFKSSRIQLVDIKTRLTKKIKALRERFIDSNYIEGESYNDQQLISLALQSGAFSRFKKDSNFVNDEFYKLYHKWISDSLNKKIADKVIVFKKELIPKGLLTLSFKNTFAEIGLLSVDEFSRGEGIGQSLLMYADEITIAKGLMEVQVSTQLQNFPAMQLYKKVGYSILYKKYIYHIWN